MGKKTVRWGCLLGSLLILFLLVAGGLWFYRFQSRKAEAPPPSPVLVFLLSPSSGAEVDAGEFVPVTLQAVAPAAIVRAELFVDGLSLGVVSHSPEAAFWSWQAYPLGIHTLTAQATAADGQVGQSQTVIVNILAGDGLMQISADEGQTLEQIGADFGVPPDQMTDANPLMDPSQPLAGGQRVQVPIANGGPGNEPADEPVQLPAGADAPFVIPIAWDMTFTEPVDQAYCYTSSGNGVWEKMPKDPFDFFHGPQSSYTQLVPPAEQVVLQMDCWGWVAGTLKYLGGGETTFNIHQPPGTLLLRGNGFQFAANLPQFDFPPESFTGASKKSVPPPFAVRFAENAAECAAHSNLLLAVFVCSDTVLSPTAPAIKEYDVLVWEWKPQSWADAAWLNQIDGYRIYQINLSTNTEKYLKEVGNPNQHAVLVPLPWAQICYGVRAYSKEPAVESQMVTYCPGQEPAPQKITLTPTDWLTLMMVTNQGSCFPYDPAVQPGPYVLENNKTGFGNQPGEVLVGMWESIVEPQICWQRMYHEGAVRFDTAGVGNSLPSNAAIQEAMLTFSQEFLKYDASGTSVTPYPEPLVCVQALYTAEQDWTDLMGGNHYSTAAIEMTPYTSIPLVKNTSGEVWDVSSVVEDWLKNPTDNHGFVLIGAPAPHPKGSGTGECLSGLGNFQLEIYYFVP